METIWLVLSGFVGTLLAVGGFYVGRRGRIVYLQHNALWQWANAMEQWKTQLTMQAQSANSKEPVQLHPIKKG